MEQLVIAICVTTKQCYVHVKTGGQCAGVCHAMLATQHIGHLVANLQVGNKLGNPLYCTVLYCTALYCTGLYHTVLYFTVLDYPAYCPPADWPTSGQYAGWPT